MLPYLCSDYIVKNQVLEAAEKQSVRHRCLPGAGSHTPSLVIFISWHPNFVFSSPVFWAQRALPLNFIKLAPGPLQTNRTELLGTEPMPTGAKNY